MATETKDSKRFDESFLIDLGYNSYYRNLLLTADAGLLGGNKRGQVFNAFGFTQAETFFRDAQVKASFNAFSYPILSRKPVFNPASDDPKAVELTDFMNWSITKVRGSIIQLMYDILTADYYGNAKIEKRFTLNTTGKYKNMYCYKSFHKKRTGLWDFVYDQETDSEVVGIKSLVDLEKRTFPLEKFIYSSGLTIDDNPNGQGTYESIAKLVTAKNEILIFMLSLASKQSNSKLPVLTIKNGADEAEVKRILNKIKKGLGIALPSGYELELHDYKTDNTQWFLDILKWLDSQIALAILGNSTSINESQGAGTNAQSKTHKETGTDPKINIWCHLITEIFEEQYMKTLIEMNYDTNIYTEEFYPTCSLVEVSKKDKKSITEWLKDAQESGFMDFTTKTDFDYARKELDLPENDEALQKVSDEKINSNLDDQDKKIIELATKLADFGTTKEDVINELELMLEELIKE